MKQAVMISVRPQWCKLITSGDKTAEIRKTRPKMETPFKCYIYQTKTGKVGTGLFTADGEIMGRSVKNGKVIGEFVCDEISQIYVGRVGKESENAYLCLDITSEIMQKRSCLTVNELYEYSNGNPLYGWHISDLVIYDRPKELREFFAPCIKNKYPHCFDCEYGLQTNEKKPLNGLRYFDIPCGNYLKKPPQSWCYAEDLG